MEDGKKPDGCIPKIPTRDITMNVVDQMIGLHDSDIMKLASAILVKEVSIKSNSFPVGNRGKESHSGLVPNQQAHKTRHEQAHGGVSE